MTTRTLKHNSCDPGLFALVWQSKLANLGHCRHYRDCWAAQTGNVQCTMYEEGGKEVVCGEIKGVNTQDLRPACFLIWRHQLRLGTFALLINAAGMDDWRNSKWDAAFMSSEGCITGLDAMMEICFDESWLIAVNWLKLKAKLKLCLGLYMWQTPLSLLLS